MSVVDIEGLELARAMDAALAGLLRVPALLDGTGADTALDNATHQALIGLDWASIAVGEDQGGLGLTWPQMARLAAVGGRRLLPAAMRGEAFALAPALAGRAAAGDAGAERHLTALLAGELRGGGLVLDAALDRGVAFLPPGADVVAVLSGDALAVVELSDPAVTVEPLSGVDAGQGAVFLRCSAGALAADAGLIAAGARERWLVATLSEAFGAAQRCLELAAEYASEREQFGTKIVSFQAVSHRLAEMAVALEAADAGIGRLVAGIEAGTPDAQLRLALCHSVPAAARSVCEGAIQVHGGAGFTWELGLHLYYRRVLTIQQQLGGVSDSAQHAGREYLRAMGGRVDG